MSLKGGKEVESCVFQYLRLQSFPLNHTVEPSGFPYTCATIKEIFCKSDCEARETVLLELLLFSPRSRKKEGLFVHVSYVQASCDSLSVCVLCSLMGATRRVQTNRVQSKLSPLAPYVGQRLHLSLTGLITRCVL